MRYVAIVLLANVILMLELGVTAQQLARVDRDVPLPFDLDGHGRAPGEVSVINTRGIVLDSERVDDVFTVRNVRWELFKVHFEFDQDGKTYESSLALEP